MEKRIVSSAKGAGGSSLAVQWLGLGAFTAGAWVQSLIRELRSCKMRHGQNKIKQKLKNKTKGAGTTGYPHAKE